MANAYLFDDPDDEQALAERFEALRAQQQVWAQTHTPELARRTAEIARMGRLGASALPLAKAGASNDAVLLAGKAKARSKARRGLGFHSLGDLVKGSSRVLMTALETPLQELQSVVRGTGWAGVRTKEGHGDYLGNVAEGVSSAGRSTGWKALEDLFAGRRVDLGSGYFPGGDVRAEQKRDSSRLQLGGKSITTGRVVADRVFDEGSRPHSVLSGLIDAGVAIGMDPTNVAGAGIAQARQARRLFAVEADAAGLISAGRQTIIPERAAEWLNGRGRRVIDKLAETDDPYEVWRLLGRKVEPDVAVALADTRSPAEARAVLEPMLGTVLREKPVEGVLGSQLGPVGGVSNLRMVRRAESIRLLGTMPGGHVRVDDPLDGAKQLERFLRNARMDSDYVARKVGGFMRADSSVQKYHLVVDEVLGDVFEKLTPTLGVQQARKITRAWRNNYGELTKYFTDEIGNNVGVRSVEIAGRSFDLPSPHLFVEFLHHAIPLPDARAIRRATAGRDWVGGKAWAWLVNQKLVEVPTAAADYFTQEIFKPFALLRGAWSARVVSEEQVRAASLGYDSIFSHPIRAIAWATGRKGGADVFGESFDAAEDASEFARAMSQRGGEWRRRIVNHGKTLYHRDRDDLDRFVDGWRDELGQLASDPIAKRVAGGWSAGDKVPNGLTGNNIDDARRWFWQGPGSAFRKEMAEASGRGDLLTREGSDAYIESVGRRLSIKTGDDARLMDAIATGRLEGQALRDKSARQSLLALADEGVGPEVVRGDIVVAGRATAGSVVGEHWNAATDWLFANLMARETNWLSRAPMFRQAYNKRLAELMPYMDEATQVRAIEGARAAGVDTKTFERLAQRGKGTLALEDADTLAKGFALDEVKKQLYSLSERQQWTDVARTVFIFGEAWAELLKVWSRIGLERPIAVRRIQQAITGAREAGYFTRDGATGAEVFNYPFTDTLVRAATGLEGTPFQANVASLNLFSNNVFMPGLGPVLQIPMAKILPDKPQWDWVRELVAPYGDPTEKGVLSAVLPAWFEKFQTAFENPESDRTFAGAVVDVSRALVASGEYSMDTVQEQERLSRAAKSRARNLYLLRGFAQFFAPAAPSPEFAARDKNGDLHTAFALSEQYRKLQEREQRGEINDATIEFLNTYGENALMYLQPKSRGGFTPTDVLHEWVRNNTELASRYKSTYGYFAPQEGEFSITELDRQLASGERDSLAPREVMDLANARVAAAKYRKARELVGARPTPGQRAWLKDIENTLLEEHPGWQPGRFEVGKLDAQIRELEQIATEPAVRRTDAGKALTKYLAARQQAMEVATDSGFATFGRAKALAHLREWLRDIASSLVEEHPDFQPLYDRVLDREMVDDAVEEASVA